MQIIGVNFKDRNSDSYQDKVYNYYCTIDDVAVGDILIAPTSSTSGDGIVRVCEIGVDPATISQKILSILKTIESRFKEISDKQEETVISTSSDLITVTQLPVIEDQLRSVKDAWDAKLKETLALPVTLETVKAIKDIRADMRREFFALDARRKEIKEIATAPVKRFEDTFKECIKDPFDTADAELKAKIDMVENGLRDKKRMKIEKHYLDRLAEHGLDFPAFAMTGIRTGISDKEEDLMKQAEDFADRIQDDVETLKELPHADELMVEYKTSLDVGRSIRVVNARHKAMEEVRQRMDIEPAAAPAIPEPLPAVPRVSIRTQQEKLVTRLIEVTGTDKQLETLTDFLVSRWYKFAIKESGNEECKA